jgi:hypothetical protein
MCGNNVEDCSCSITCKTNGDCCTDYDTHDCQNIFNNAAAVDPAKCASNQGCQFCDAKKTVTIKGESVPYCNLCKDVLLFLDGTCVNSCPADRVLKASNNICLPKPTCSIENCASCEEGSTTKCKTCAKGTFKFDEKCVTECPANYRADRITWSCLEPPVFAWYWVFPSRGSCKTNCGVVIQQDWDCSCDFNCFQWGNCCQDIEDFCPDLLFWRKKGANLKLKASKDPKADNNLKPEAKKAEKKESDKEVKKEVKKAETQSSFLKKKD